MGCGYEAACMDCRERAEQFGYGSGATWLVGCTTLEEFDRQPEELRRIPKNQAWRRFIERHQGHRVEIWNEDYTMERNGVIHYDQEVGLPPIDLRGFTVLSFAP